MPKTCRLILLAAMLAAFGCSDSSPETDAGVIADADAAAGDDGSWTSEDQADIDEPVSGDGDCNGDGNGGGDGEGDVDEDGGVADQDQPEIIDCGRSTGAAGPWPEPPVSGPCQGYTPGSDPLGSFCDCLAIPGCDRPYIVGHAGGTFVPSQANRIATYEENCPLGMDFIETDVQLTVDGGLVYLHDETFWGRPVSEMTVAEIKELDETVITMEESYTWAQTHRVLFMQDFKGASDVIPVAVARTRECGMLDRVVFFGDAAELELVTQADPQAWKMLRVGSPEEARQAADDPDPYRIALHGDPDYTDAVLVADLHQGGKRYLVNIMTSGPICSDMYAQGVDLVQTNFVQYCADVLDDYLPP